MKLRLLADLKLQNQTVLVRVDYNVPLARAGKSTTVKDPRRILASMTTVEALRAKNNKVILLSHLGRPTSEAQEKYSLRPVFEYLRANTDWPLVFVADYTDKLKTKKMIAEAPPKTVFLFENLRFQPGEKKNEAKFVKLLAGYGDAFINDAFSAAHRAHASTVGLAKALPSAAGLSLAAEVEAFANLLDHPRHPFIVIVGGAKISDKIEPIVNLAKIADTILIGGGVANNFFQAVGLAIQKSYLQDAPADLQKEGLNYVGVADQIIIDNLGERFLKDGYVPLPKIIYPMDVMAAASLEAKRAQVIDLTSKDQICDTCGQMYLDIGPKTIRLYKELILQAETVFWNGPMGVFEQKPFARGTREIARAVAKTGAVSVAGGGDTLAALDKFGYYNSIDYVSMAGSAALEFLSGKQLPAAAVLEKKR